MSDDVVKLDVGGTIFKTSKGTLIRLEGTFRTMFEQEEKIKKDENECIFIDRDPKHFRLILNFMRDDYTVLPDSKKEIEEIIRESEAYRLEGLYQMCLEHLPEENSQKFRSITSDEQMVHLITNPVKPVIIIYYHMENWATATKYFDISKFQEHFQRAFDIYFKLMPGPGVWAYSIHDVVPTIYCQPKSCQENNFCWSIDNSIQKFWELKENR